MKISLNSNIITSSLTSDLKNREYASSPNPQYSVEEFKRDIFYKRHYDPVGIYALHESSYPEAIGKKSGVRTCRFCSKSRPEITFRKTAHVIPRFMGNEKWVSFEECDQCNEIFSKYESSLGAFTNLERTFSRIKGHRGVPAFEDKNIIIKNSREEPELSLFSSADVITDGPKDEPNSADLHYTLPSHRPINVYKSLAKSALSAWPGDDLKSFGKLRSWLIDENDFSSVDDQTNYFCWRSIINGPFRFSPPFLFLFKRKPNSLVPYATAILGFGASVFQIYIPSPEQDKVLSGRNIELQTFVPPAIRLFKSRGCRYTIDKLHLNNAEIIRDQKRSIRLLYGARFKLN